MCRLSLHATGLKDKTSLFLELCSGHGVNFGAAAVLTVLGAQSFLGGTKIKFKAPLARVINFKFQKSTFYSGSDAVYQFLFLMVRQQLGGRGD